jgi:hypothetical protein
VHDFGKATSGMKFWDLATEDIFNKTGVPLEDSILQNREEFLVFCEWIAAHRITSYLEIGTWTGLHLLALHRIFRFQRVAACDIGLAAKFGLPLHLVGSGVPFFLGNSHSVQYEHWRQALGHIDLVFIDGDHSYDGVLSDFQINRQFPFKYLAFHDIKGSSPSTAGVKRFWDELEGNKHEIVRLRRDDGPAVSAMGIGIWWD